MGNIKRTLRNAALTIIAVTGLVFAPGSTVQADQTDLVGPAGSGGFGRSVTVLLNGNIVVTDPYYDVGSTDDVGAVYLYNGATGALISTLTGSTADDRVGYDAVVELSNGNYVVISRYWINAGAADAGAVTWCSGIVGCTGVVSSTNSLVGSTAGDQVGIYGVGALSNGNYMVLSYYWDNGGAADAGAVTWCSGTGGCTGVISSTNSLIGSTAGDQVGINGMKALSNGNYVVCSPYWDNDAGAVTWCSGTVGCTGVVASTNSLVGSTAGDQIGSDVTALSNGNYVVISPNWDNSGAADAGAVTWGSGTTGVSGAISSTNSLVGSTAGDQVGDDVVMLSNGNYVVDSLYWDNGGAVDAGAVTWGSGTTGVSGVVSSTNSLVGSTADDWVGAKVTALNNGNYVVGSPDWDNGGTVNAGAVTWCSGTAGCTGVVSSTNSLVGSTAGDYVGSGDVVALSNGNYVVGSPGWDNGGVANVGAATWMDGTSGTSGGVSSTNSLVGSTADDRVGAKVTALNNGNYVVGSPGWGNGGAVTWRDGTSGTSGVVSSTNSLVGSTAGDQVGTSVMPLSNGNYVVISTVWDNGGAADAGAVTWCSGTGGCTGIVSSTNSLVGSTADDRAGIGVMPLSNGDYVVGSPYWNNGGVVDAGAATWCNGTGGCTGVISSTNSLVGSTADDWVGSVTVLSNNNYVVCSPSWDNGGATDAGAVTWCSGTGGCTGVVSSTNSLVGSTADDYIGGSNNVVVLSNGNYVVVSPTWDNGGATNVGAVTWCSGAVGCTGVISSTNSLVGSTANDRVGSGTGGGVTALSNGNYVVRSPYWDNGGATNAGAVTWGNGTSGVSGAITAENSVLGTATNGGNSMIWAYDDTNAQLVVGRPADDIVTLFAISYRVYLPLVLGSY